MNVPLKAHSQVLKGGTCADNGVLVAQVKTIPRRIEIEEWERDNEECKEKKERPTTFCIRKRLHLPEWSHTERIALFSPSRPHKTVL